MPKIVLSLMVFEKTFSIFAKIQDGVQNLKKATFFRGPRGAHNLPEISLSLMVYKIYNIFHFHLKVQKTKMWTDRQTDVGHINLIGGLVTRSPPKKSLFVRGPRAVIFSNLRVQKMPEIALSLMVFKITDIFHFRQIQDGGQFQKNLNFSESLEE